VLFAQSERAYQIHLLANQHSKVLVISKDTLCTESIVEAIQSLLRHVDIATNDGELRWVLNQKHSFQLVIIDADSLGSLYGLMDAIKFTWPHSELILVSEDMHSWMELIQRGAYEMLPKPVNSDDLVWAVIGALLKRTPSQAMCAVS
jgi:DNA-binding NtrC family response regulator